MARNFINYYSIPDELAKIIGNDIIQDFGNRLGCVILAEVAKHPLHVKYDRASAQNAAQPYLGLERETKIAPHYVLADSNDYVKYRYLFVYSDYSSSRKLNRFMLLVLIYILVLLAVAAIKSRGLERFMRRYTK